MGGGERGEGCHPSDLLCWLTVIWSGAPTDSLEEAPHANYSKMEQIIGKERVQERGREGLGADFMS